jgi:hypothetical protein
MNRAKFILVVLILLAGPMFASAWTGITTQYWNDGVGCSNSNNFAVWTNITKIGAATTYSVLNLSVVFNSSGNVGNCSKYRHISNITCCPTGYECNLISGKCNPRLDRLCEDFKTKESCESANLVSGKNPAELFFEAVGDGWKIGDISIYEAKCNYPGSGEYEKVNGEICANFSSCLCYWNVSCETNWEDYTVCEGGPAPVGRCEYELVETKNQCDTLGKITMIYKATAYPQGYTGCTAPPNKEVSCSAVVVVPFFSFANVIASLLGIAGIYFLFGKKMHK